MKATRSFVVRESTMRACEWSRRGDIFLFTSQTFVEKDKENLAIINFLKKLYDSEYELHLISIVYRIFLTNSWSKSSSCISNFLPNSNPMINLFYDVYMWKLRFAENFTHDIGEDNLGNLCEYYLMPLIFERFIGF